MDYIYKATVTFWKNYRSLSEAQRASASEKFAIFKRDPWDPSLRTHSIRTLSSRMGKTVYSSRIEGDLRVVFYKDASTIVSLDIGTHAIYK